MRRADIRHDIQAIAARDVSIASINITEIDPAKSDDEQD
jgi:hypothetical protein